MEIARRVSASDTVWGVVTTTAPATGTVWLRLSASSPVPGGLSWRETLLLLQLLADDHEIDGFDVVEVGDDEWDANVGARLLYKLAGWAIATRGTADQTPDRQGRATRGPLG